METIVVSDFLSLVTVWAFCCLKVKNLFHSMDDYLALPSDFQKHLGDVILLDIRDMDDVSLAAEQIQMFCRGYKLDKAIGYKAAVCFEELAVNIIRHGFPKCKKRPGIDLRVVNDDENLILRLQDNCPVFDVEREIALAMHQGPAALERQIGLKILSAMAPDIKYVHTLETNNVIIRVPYISYSCLWPCLRGILPHFCPFWR